jgi:hypothetical protein
MRTKSGQAVVEYLLVFSFIALLSINMVKGLGLAMGTASGSLGFVLSQQLTIGVCPSTCFSNDFANGLTQ